MAYVPSDLRKVEEEERRRRFRLGMLRFVVSLLATISCFGMITFLGGPLALLFAAGAAAFAAGTWETAPKMRVWFGE